MFETLEIRLEFTRKGDISRTDTPAKARGVPGVPWSTSCGIVYLQQVNDIQEWSLADRDFDEVSANANLNLIVLSRFIWQLHVECKVQISQYIELCLVVICRTGQKNLKSVGFPTTSHSQRSLNQVLIEHASRLKNGSQRTGLQCCYHVSRV